MKNKLLLLLLLTTTLLRGADINVTDHIEILAQTAGSAIIKSDIPVSASIDGHALTIHINENVGIAHIVVTNRNGVYTDSDNLFHTPDMATLLIDDEGFYTVTITLNNGDVYYGDFMVTE